MVEPVQYLRDCAGLTVTCTNPDALPVYNELLLVTMAMRQSPLRLAHTVLELDPGLTLVHCLLGCMWLSDLAAPSDPKVSVHIRAVREAEERGELTERERRHVQALLAFSEGDLPRATHHWAHILIHHPRDLLAVKLLFGSCIHLGEFEKMRNSLAGVMPHWSQDMQSYPFLLAFFAFSLEQTNYKDRAEEVARQALSLEKRNPWATHALSHVIEEARPAEVGVELLTRTREDWLDSGIGGHIDWHLALYYLRETASVTVGGWLSADARAL